jgi:hypothetical protein
MKKLNEILFITEFPDTGKWELSFLIPEFQGGESVEISKEDAKKLICILSYPQDKDII